MRLRFGGFFLVASEHSSMSSFGVYYYRFVLTGGFDRVEGCYVT